MSKKRSKQIVPFKERLALWAQRNREDAARLQPGPQRDELLEKAQQADTAAHLVDWVESPRLHPNERGASQSPTGSGALRSDAPAR
jgi:hypothetical protein